MIVAHKERDHSKFSASGAERWIRCAPSVELEEKSPPSKDTEWSKEGTFAHELLERVMRKVSYQDLKTSKYYSSSMLAHVEKTAQKVFAIYKVYGGTLLIEKRVYASFLHPEMFGTCDIIIAGSEGTLHIIDFKYGKGHIVDAHENHQLLQYAMSVAESYNWDFQRVKMWVMQPRAGGDWHKSWVIPMTELKGIWVPLWERAVERVERGDDKPNPGSWCHWCRAKGICPAKKETRVNKIINAFKNMDSESEDDDGFEEKSQESKIEKEGKEVYFGSFEDEEKEESEKEDFY